MMVRFDTISTLPLWRLAEPFLLARPLLRWLVFVWRAMAMTHADEFDLWMQVRDTILVTCVYYWELNIDGRTELEC